VRKPAVAYFCKGCMADSMCIRSCVYCQVQTYFKAHKLTIFTADVAEVHVVQAASPMATSLMASVLSALALGLKTRAYTCSWAAGQDKTHCISSATLQSSAAFAYSQHLTAVGICICCLNADGM
jgi:hypothetical protein